MINVIFSKRNVDHLEPRFCADSKTDSVSELSRCVRVCVRVCVCVCICLLTFTRVNTILHIYVCVLLAQARPLVFLHPTQTQFTSVSVTPRVCVCVCVRGTQLQFSERVNTCAGSVHVGMCSGHKVGERLKAACVIEC